jgi:acyl-CoA thioester hydrolase
MRRGLMASYWQLHPLRVRYQETDQMAVVYHANYVNWFEIGRTEFIRHAGMSYRDIELAGLLLPVTELAASFERPARYDERLAVCTRIGEFSRFRLHFESQIRRIAEEEELPKTVSEERGLPGELLVSGGTKHVWLNRDWRPARLDRMAPELYELLGRLTEASE